MLAFLLSTLLAVTPPAKTDWRTPFEKGDGNTTTTYAECIAYYQKLAAAYPEITLRVAGTTDIGQPLHEVVVSLDGDADPASVRAKGRRVVFIQNGIHPGEPEGIDASMLLARDYVQQRARRQQLANITLVIIPVYNVDGMLNRSATSRANQNGPAAYGFRGNARNLDLNRDYIKQDSRNARSFAQLFQRWQPDVFVDTHTSNGADYQYTLTLIDTQKDKLHPALSRYMQQTLLPDLYAGMEQKKWPLTPYVDFPGRTPESGLHGFLETPRYSTGYAALFNTLGFITETHMWKPFAPRVRTTYDFLDLLMHLVHRDATQIARARATADQQLRAQTAFPVSWQLDTTVVDRVNFRGYEGRTRTSAVSGQPRLSYDHKAPFTRPVNFFNTYVPGVTVTSPRAYLIPQAWGEVLDKLRLSNVQLHRLRRDTTLTAEVYYVEDYKTSPRPYEGHYLHSQVTLRPERQSLPFRRGDFVAYLDQPARRYLVETLEPQATDSFFAWGFFDSILQQKEYFSDYVFEDLAAELLRRDPALRQQLTERQKSDPVFAQSAGAQLDFVYRHSVYYEKSHLRYPVARWLGEGLPVE